MSNIESIARRACSLLGKSPDGAAVGVWLAGGYESFVTPDRDPSVAASLLLRAGIIRPEERRPQYDLRVQIEERDGKYQVSLERITGVAALATIPDPSEYLGRCQAADLAEAEAAVCQLLKDKVPESIELRATTIRYRKSKFALKSFTPDRGQTQNRGLSRLIYGASRDTEVASFVQGVVTDALSWSPECRAPQDISLWFTVNGECLKTIYTTIAVHGSSFVMSASDQSCWPWKERAINCTVDSAEAVKAKISDYIDGQYRFQLKSLEVFFAWSEAL